jgi:hypothetical protein
MKGEKPEGENSATAAISRARLTGAKTRTDPGVTSAETAAEQRGQRWVPLGPEVKSEPKCSWAPRKRTPRSNAKTTRVARFAGISLIRRSLRERG